MRTIRVNHWVGQSKLESGEIEVNQLMHEKTNAVLQHAISPVRTGRNLHVKWLMVSEQRGMAVNGAQNPIAGWSCSEVVTTPSTWFHRSAGPSQYVPLP